MTAEGWTKIFGSVLGAAILAMQGINLGETSAGNEAGQKREEILNQVLQIAKDEKTAMSNQTRILQNGADSLVNQAELLRTVKAAIEERRGLLEKNLEDLRESVKHPPPSPTPP